MAGEPTSGAVPGRRLGPGYIVGAAIFGWVAIVLLNSSAAREPVRCDSDLTPDRDTVVMLSASWCGYCRRARDYLHEQAIAHCEYDVETTAEGRRRFAAMPVKVIPVISIRGDTLIGFNRSEISQALIAHGLAGFGDYDERSDATTR
jgi:mycoredoxin